MKETKFLQKLLSILIAVIMVVGMLPVTALAGEHDNQVRVIVENTTFMTAADSVDGATAPEWTGTLVDKWVDINNDSSVATCLIAALGNEHTQVGAESNYISSIDGLAAGAGAGQQSGWMFTLNDWFTNEGVTSYTVADGGLKSGDELRFMYTNANSGGADIGGGYGSEDKTLKAVSVTGGNVSEDFSPEIKEYTLKTSSASVQIVPTASNKNYQVKIFVGDTEYARGADIPVSEGTVITVKCGDPSWPTMNASSSPAEVYKFTVKGLGTLLNAESIEVNTTKEDSSGTGTRVAITYDSALETFSGTLTNFTEVAAYNDADVTVTVKGLSATATAQLKTSSGTKIADFVGGTASTSGKAVSGIGDHIFIISVKDGEKEEDYKLKLSKTTSVKISTLVFAGSPEFGNVKYYGEPEGTLFQLDKNGERTGKTGLSQTCFNYAVYVGPGMQSVNIAGDKALDIWKNFSYNNVKASMYVNNEAKISAVPTCMAMAMKISKNFKDGIALGVGDTVIRFEFAKAANDVVNLTVTFTKPKVEVNDFIKMLEDLDIKGLVYPDDVYAVESLNTVLKGYTEDEKAKIPAELKTKLEQAVEIMRTDRVPEKVEIIEKATKLIYSKLQSFDPTGTVIKATYSDGTTRTLTEGYTVTPSGAVGTASEVVYTYNTVTVSQPITVPVFDLEGDGTEATPYLIKNADDLAAISMTSQSGEHFAEKYFKFTNDITLPDGWVPIGANSYDYCFSGQIDGDNHLLTVPKGGLPLISYVQDALIKNLNIYGEQIEGYGLVNDYSITKKSGIAVTIDNVNLKSGTKTLYSGLVGGDKTRENGFAVASAGYTVIVRNCTIEKGVVIGYTGEVAHIGSFSGRVNGTFDNCVSYATVKGASYVGGIVGDLDNAMSQLKITNCHFHGTVEASGDCVGGIVGGVYSNSTAPNGSLIEVQKCTSDGTIKGKNYVGGILGADRFTAQPWGSGKIKDNVFTGKVSATTNDKKYIGGIIGYLCSFNKGQNVENNLYSVDCGVEKGIGFVHYIDTNYPNPTQAEGTIYFSTEFDVLGCPAVTGCGWQTGNNRTDDPIGVDADKFTKKILAESIEISAKDTLSTELDDGVLKLSTGSFELKATVTPAIAEETYGVSWSSSMPKVAAVDKDGKVTPLGTGIAMISATVGGKSATVLVEVKKSGAVTVNDAANIADIAEAILPTAGKAQAEAIAEAVNNMKDSEKSKLSDKVIKNLDEAMANAHTVEVVIEATVSGDVAEAERVGTEGHSAIGLVTASGTKDLDGKTVKLKINQVKAESKMEYTFELELDLDNTEVKLASPVIVTIKMPEGYVHNSSYKVKHTLNNGNVEWLPITYDKAANTITFRADRFSVFSVGIAPAANTSGTVHIIGGTNNNAAEENPNTGYEAPAELVIASVMLLAAAASIGKKRR